MRTSSFVAALCTALLFAAPVAAQQPPLTIVNTGPSGSLDSLAQANEIRIVFSEPMVTLGRIPNPVTAPFVRITPAITGTFRWSGTTILIFTPDPKRPLPFATSYEVTVDTSATAVSGRRLAKAETVPFHDADRASAPDQLVSPHRDRGQPDGGAAPIQSAGQVAGRRGASHGVARAPRVGSAGVLTGRGDATSRCGCDRTGRIQSQGRSHSPDRRRVARQSLFA